VLNRRRISQIEGFVASPSTGNFMLAAKENARRTLLCGDDSPQEAIEKITSEVNRIERDLEASLGTGALDRLVELFHQARKRPEADGSCADEHFDWANAYEEHDRRDLE